jgi:hypothetical protein
VANLKVERDYHKAMEVVLQRTQKMESGYDRPHWSTPVRKMCIPLHSPEDKERSFEWQKVKMN